MKQFITNFNTTADLAAFSATSACLKPHVSLTKDNRQVHFINQYAGHDYVDLGLPSGTKWATMNIGATGITDAGLYFQWGDTSGYTSGQCGSNEGQKYFGWEDYKYGDGTSSPDNTAFTKYNSTDGCLVLTSTVNGNTLTFPAVGFCDGGNMWQVNSGYYWSNSIFSSNVRQARLLYFHSTYVYWQTGYARCHGHPIRPVAS